MGIAGEKGKMIATLKLKSVEDIPSFLKIERVLKSIREFFEYSKTYEIYGGTVSNRTFITTDEEMLYQYIDC